MGFNSEYLLQNLRFFFLGGGGGGEVSTRHPCEKIKRSFSMGECMASPTGS